MKALLLVVGPTARSKLQWLLTVVALVAQPAATPAAQITFNFTFEDQTDSTGVGFDDPTSGAAARAALQAEANYISSAIYVNVNRTVNIKVLDSPTTNGASELASATVNYGPDPGKASFLPTQVQSIIQTGTNPSSGDSTLKFNFAADRPWQFGTTVDNTHYDFRSTALHELAHHLGWASLISSDGSGVGSTGLVYAVYDKFVKGYNGTSYASFINTDGAGKPTGHQAAAQLIDTAHHLKFSGPFSDDEGGPFDLTTIDPFKDNSSVSHLSDNSDVMGDSSEKGQGQQTFSLTDITILKDLGYTFNVPEPSGLVLLASSMVAGALLQHRRKALARAH